MDNSVHIHTHNGFGECTGLDYIDCHLCHCHLQDENHTACCRGEGAREMYAQRQEMLERARASRR